MERNMGLKDTIRRSVLVGAALLSTGFSNMEKPQDNNNEQNKQEAIETPKIEETTAKVEEVKAETPEETPVAVEKPKRGRKPKKVEEPVEE